MSDVRDAELLPGKTSVRRRPVVSLLALSCVFAALLSLILWSLGTGSPPDPMYKGRNVSLWAGSISALNQEDDAVKTVKDIGQPAVPYLVEMLEPKSLFFTRWKSYWWVWQKAPDALRSRIPRPYDQFSYRQRPIAAYTLGLIGPSARAALPALMKASRDPDPSLRVYSVQAIGQIRADPKSVSSCLIERLNDESFLVRLQAARSLAIIGSEEPKALAVLSALVNSTNVWLHSAAAVALWRTDPRSDRLVTVSNLFKAAPGARSGIAFLLGEIGSPATNAIPLLQAAFQDGDEQVRRIAHDAMEKIQRHTDSRTKKN